MQTDGNFVLYNFDGKPLWSSKTNGQNNSFLIMQDDGNLVIYKPDTAVWATMTHA